MSYEPPFQQPPQQPGPYGHDPQAANPYAANPYAAGAYPDPAVRGSYQVPGQPVVPGGFQAGYTHPDDPLVTPPGVGIGGWFNRVTGGVGRSWRSTGVILGVTQILPSMVLAVFTLWLSEGLANTNANASAAEVRADQLAQVAWISDNLVILALGGLVGGIVLTFVQAAGWAGSTWALTMEAAGQPAPIGAAFSYGFRRALGLWGWTLLSGLIIGVGFVLCILPGIYFAFALALVGPVYLYERENPIGRSFRLFHDNFGPVLGRALLILVALFAGSIVSSLVQSIGTLASGSPGLTPARVVFSLIGTALTLPFVIVQFVGIVATYTEVRAREAPIGTQDLAAALA
jgi:hypothetical protein